MAQDISAGLRRAQGRRFGLTVGAAFLVFAGIAAWRDHPLAWRILASLGGALVAGGLVFPAAMLPVERAWMKMAHAISRVTTPIVMGILFFVILTPIGVVRRALGRGTLRSSRGESQWKLRPQGGRRGDLTRQF